FTIARPWASSDPADSAIAEACVDGRLRGHDGRGGWRVALNQHRHPRAGGDLRCAATSTRGEVSWMAAFAAMTEGGGGRFHRRGEPSATRGARAGAAASRRGSGGRGGVADDDDAHAPRAVGTHDEPAAD